LDVHELLDWAVDELKQARGSHNEPTEEEIQSLREWVFKTAVEWTCLIVVWTGDAVLGWDQNAGKPTFRKAWNVEPSDGGYVH
jgi:hypothetical protein